jgi:hypothetical protein
MLRCSMSPGTLRARTAVVLLLAGAVATGCVDTPRVGDDSLDAGIERVRALTADARSFLPPHDVQPTVVNPSKPCRRTVAGYAVGKAGSRRAESLVAALLEPIANPADARARSNAARERIVEHWIAQGYEIDHSEEDDPRFVRTRARVDDDYEIMATAFADPLPRDRELRPQVTVYAVSSCLER